ncbi:sugar ABC transporter substrate-binding protein [Clostridiaceae bacterium]|nr:sugar ABC transporter substrate-binding protein [Clostridium sp.]NBI69833.1 sugar ABC transporter substrate-binding protein [Clostridiaceae bacterium]
MNKWRHITALLGTAAVLLAACGGSKTEEAGQQASGESSGELTVAIWDTYQEPGLKEMMAGFTEETGISVKIQVTPWDQYWTMMEAGATGGTMPDVFWMHSNQVAKYAEYDLLLDLSDYIGTSEVTQMDKFPQELVELYQNKDGKQVAIPKDVDTVALWYNKTAFDEAGLSYPDETWTWDDFREAAKALTKEDGSQYGTVFGPKSNHETYYNLIYDWGGNIISEDKTVSGWDDPKTIEAMEFVAGMIADGSMPPYTTIAENEALALFESGKVAMCMFGSWQSDLFSNEYVKENCDVTVLPEKDGARISIYNGLGWAASSESAHTEEAWKLLEYLSSEKAQKQQADLGITMSAYEGTSDGFVKRSEEFNLQAYVDMMDQIVIRPYSKDTVVWENMSHEMLVNAWNGSASMADVCGQIAASMNESLQKEQ